jgi:hypothetical protein
MIRLATGSSSEVAKAPVEYKVSDTTLRALSRCSIKGRGQPVNRSTSRSDRCDELVERGSGP